MIKDELGKVILCSSDLFLAGPIVGTMLDAIIVRVMTNGSRRVRYSVFTSSKGVIKVCVPLNKVAKYVNVE